MAKNELKLFAIYFVLGHNLLRKKLLFRNANFDTKCRKLKKVQWLNQIQIRPYIVFIFLLFFLKKKKLNSTILIKEDFQRNLYAYRMLAIVIITPVKKII